MKKIITVVFSSLLVFTTSAAVANTANGNMKSGAMHKNWTCTTNASSSTATNDMNADNQMKTARKPAKDAFAFAVKNCRDCTEITCETNE